MVTRILLPLSRPARQLEQQQYLFERNDTAKVMKKKLGDGHFGRGQLYGFGTEAKHACLGSQSQLAAGDFGMKTVKAVQAAEYSSHGVMHGWPGNPVGYDRRHFKQFRRWQIFRQKHDQRCGSVQMIL
jgi:hypothetical protein